MVRPLRSQQVDLPSEIRRTAWSQMAELGAAGISLRSIARALHITAPAIYNHFPSRDDLVTELIREAYQSLGDAQAAARASIAVGDHAGRLRATGISYRDWALTYPQRYQLIFGAPIPGYVCPMDRTADAAAYSLSSLVGVLADAHQDGHLRVQVDFPISDEKRASYTEWQRRGVQAGYQAFCLALVVWGRVHGLVSLEIGHLAPEFGPEPGILFEFEIEQIVQELIV
jgi:AcrR family transcriptional regulator